MGNDGGPQTYQDDPDNKNSMCHEKISFRPETSRDRPDCITLIVCRLIVVELSRWSGAKPRSENLVRKAAPQTPAQEPFVPGAARGDFELAPQLCGWGGAG